MCFKFFPFFVVMSCPHNGLIKKRFLQFQTLVFLLPSLVSEDNYITI